MVASGFTLQEHLATHCNVEVSFFLSENVFSNTMCTIRCGKSRKSGIFRNVGPRVSVRTKNCWWYWGDIWDFSIYLTWVPVIFNTFCSNWVIWHRMSQNSSCLIPIIELLVLFPTKHMVCKFLYLKVHTITIQHNNKICLSLPIFIQSWYTSYSYWLISCT